METEILAGVKDLAKALRTFANILDTGASVEGKKSRKSADDEPPDDQPVTKEQMEEDDDFKPAKKGKKSAAASFDDDEANEEEKPAKKSKKKKLTPDDLNDVCMAAVTRLGGGKKGRDAVLKILKKVAGVTSISAIDEADFTAVVEALSDDET